MLARKLTYFFANTWKTLPVQKYQMFRAFSQHLNFLSKQAAKELQKVANIEVLLVYLRLIEALQRMI